ncbi:hypothetical protein SAMD00019534_121970 [Acytostelium subglobosum LB1]|uniref:hypothetical protein n=1 Tax=Acytostelium subglobosum LB1 TaxID=1410327 RepID=UPI0006447C1D|nr:hypothetical protein SAMD00019534_121970 [Acytostelium subglobosum LB1]GAM29021.1 hypothetical protein SAMD00019534_121970 [Acytostelium subglobosum LB1]|eukprot:XP_012748027.1 hypothetical protein SAMD00019534_121970 [Acytostelium subglobosum LB1]
MGSSSSKASSSASNTPSTSNSSLGDISAPSGSSHVDYRSKPNIEEIGVGNHGGIDVSKSILDFNMGDRPCPLRTTVQDQFAIANMSKNKLKFQLEPLVPQEFQLSFSPASGTIEKGKVKLIKVKLVVLQKINTNHKAVLRVEGGVSHFLTVKIRCETGVFGVDPSTLEQVEDEGYRVPAILVQMKRSLIEFGGLEQEGIFRLAGEQTEIKRIKGSMNKNEFTSSNDINTVASLIKIWYRELPTPILNSIPTENIFHCNDVETCVEAVNRLPSIQKNLLDWLLALLLQVASHASVNKMTLQNLAIVVAPNLYDVSSSNPMEGLVLSQKCVQFIHNVLTYRLAHQSERAIPKVSS